MEKFGEVASLHLEEAVLAVPLVQTSQQVQQAQLPATQRGQQQQQAPAEQQLAALMHAIDGLVHHTVATVSEHLSLVMHSTASGGQHGRKPSHGPHAPWRAWEENQFSLLSGCHRQRTQVQRNGSTRELTMTDLAFSNKSKGITSVAPRREALEEGRAAKAARWRRCAAAPLRRCAGGMPMPTMGGSTIAI